MLEWIGLLPLLGLTGNWRGYRMGGKAIGGASMSTDMKKKFEAARASGNMDQARAMADKAQEIKDAGKAAAVADQPKKFYDANQIERELAKSDSAFTEWSKKNKLLNYGEPGFDKQMAEIANLGKANVDRLKSSAAPAYKKLEDKAVGLIDSRVKVLEKIDELKSQSSKLNDRSAKAEWKKSSKRRSVDNPLGLSGDGRGDQNVFGTKRKGVNKEIARLESRMDRINKQLDKIDNQGQRLVDTFDIRSEVGNGSVGSKAAQRSKKWSEYGDRKMAEQEAADKKRNKQRYG